MDLIVLGGEEDRAMEGRKQRLGEAREGLRAAKRKLSYSSSLLPLYAKIQSQFSIIRDRYVILGTNTAHYRPSSSQDQRRYEADFGGASEVQLILPNGDTQVPNDRT